MPAPRECRSCGSDLSPEVRWCIHCYAPVTEFAARPASAPGNFVDVPRHDMAYSRWTKSATSFGPRGRVIATLLVIACGPWTLYGGFQIANPFFLWYLLGYMIAAVLVLKHIWVRVPISEGTDGSAPKGRYAFHGRLAWLSRRVAIPPRLVLIFLGLILIGAVVALGLQGGSESRYALVVLGTMTGVGVVLAWLSGI